MNELNDINKVAKYLNEIYNYYIDKELAITIFGIKYGKIIKENNLLIDKILSLANVDNANLEHLKQSIKLADYAYIKDEEIIDQKYYNFKKLLEIFVKQLRINNGLCEGKVTVCDDKKGKEFKNQYFDVSFFGDIKLDIAIKAGSQVNTKANNIHFGRYDIKPNFNKNNDVISLFLTISNHDNTIGQDILAENQKLEKVCYKIDDLGLFDNLKPNELIQKLFNDYFDLIKRHRQYFLVTAEDIYYFDKIFEINGIIDWRQDNSFGSADIGDIAYIYLNTPISQIKYKCIVIKKDLNENDAINDTEFLKSSKKISDYKGNYIRFKLLKHITDDRLKYQNLLKYGLKQRPSSGRLSDEATIDYIEEIFNEKTQFEYDYNFEHPGTNLIVYGTPGCGKSYYVEHTLLKDYRHNEEGLCIDAIRTTFYQDYSNSDFVGQIMPIVKSDRSVSYEFIPGPFALALNKAIQNENKPVALVIEELNRGNAASIFGDIFQLLDRENGTSVYSITNVNIQKYLEEQNPEYSFNYIKIPSNLSIIATMNTSDQNVYTLDTAFKRRWKFEKLQNVFTEEHEYANWYIPGMNRTWKDFCNTINNFIIESSDEITNSEDKQLGVYFVDKKGLRKPSIDTTNEKDIKEFAYKVFEYLWDDVMKISKDTMFKNSKSLDELINTYVEKGQANKGEEVFVDNFFKTSEH